MDIKWIGKPALAETLKPGTFFAYSKDDATHLGLRVDELTPAPTKGFISLTSGYQHRPNRPAYYQIAALGGWQTVYAMSDVHIALPTDRMHVRPGRYMSQIEPGLIVQVADKLFLVVARLTGFESVVDLANGILTQQVPNIAESVWFSAWTIFRRQDDDSKTIFDIKLDFGSSST